MLNGNLEATGLVQPGRVLSLNCSPPGRPLR